ncbi:MAG TPA: methyltransferase domain-containing protein [Jatrophihabitantaceae bacterium]|nr:methyltransferase domain-containing protein [Jatrophihabitantaceae bacterium]
MSLPPNRDSSAGPLRAGPSGVVESFDESGVHGWVELPSAAEPVAVDLLVDDEIVARSWAGEPLERRSTREVRAFAFALDDLWEYVGPGNRLSVQYRDSPLPITGHGMHYAPARGGTSTLSELLRRLGAGEQFDRAGKLKLPKSLDAKWQADALRLYADLRDELMAQGLQAALVYGTLLGAVREGGFIGLDLDFDCAYLSPHRDGSAAAQQLRKLAFALIDKGFRVQAERAYLTISRPEAPAVRIKLFHLYADATGSLHFPFGTAGDAAITAESWLPLREISLAGGTVLVPHDAERVLEAIYGPDWSVPDPGFRWSRDRSSAAISGQLPEAAVEEIYWADFYAHTTFQHGSTFFDAVNARADLPDCVVDIGCGDGRDSFAFARAGRAKITGLDRSHVAVQQAARKAAELGLDDRLTFVACDVSEAEALRAILTAARRGDEPIAFYARFFLHSIPEDVQRTLLSVVAACARPGDFFAAEFRTDRDEVLHKTYGKHFRRFQSGQAFGRSLRDRYGFVPLVEQEGNGFSPYQGEDPQLYRVIARRP